MDQILEQCFADMGVEISDVINFATFSDAMQLHSDRTGKKYTKQQLKAMFDDADWYGTARLKLASSLRCAGSPVSYRTTLGTAHISIQIVLMLTLPCAPTLCACSRWTTRFS